MFDRGPGVQRTDHDRGVRAVRIALLALGALLLAACEQTDAAGRCNLEAAQAISFTNTEAPDSVVVQAIGPSCDKAVGLYVVRSNEGYPIWSWSAPLAHRFGDVFAPEDIEHTQTFLDTWAQPSVATTSLAPPWEDVPAGQTTLDQLTYEDVRARDLPMLCHFSGTARETCVFWEPAAGGAGHMFERDVAETVE